MIELSRLYQIAESEDIEVDCFDLRSRDALSLMDETGKCYIAINPYRLESTTDERVKLAHELGHCLTGSFYSASTAVDCRRRHENRADKWAIKKIIPENELKNAAADGCAEIWEFAERFGVTEQFIQKTICYYTHGNLATELYF